tara:strand:- start:4170 stop:5126 length:957 start_codon:yes stop_codon:yes gene_type:complete
MKLILEKWKAYTQDCKTADGQDGSAVVKKSESGEVESCHSSKDKAEAAVSARYANYKKESIEEDDVIEEMSSMSGGNVQGYTGSPISDEETVKKFNESEKEISKLKGKKLAEMFSTSTQTGGVPQSRVKPEDEHEGHVERSKHQGLRNVMEQNDDPAGIGQKLSDFANNSRNASRVFDILRDIEENIGLEKLKDAIEKDRSASSRANVMISKFGYDSDLLEKVKNNDDEAIKKYYQFLINEFLFWIAYNPMSSAMQYSQRSAMLSKPTKNLAFGLISQYVSDPNKNNPKAKGQRLANQAKDYKLDSDLDPAIYELPEE